MKSITEQRMTMIFNEWAKRCIENPSNLSEMIDPNGNLRQEYGQECAVYFIALADELDRNNLLPKPEKGEKHEKENC